MECLGCRTVHDSKDNCYIPDAPLYVISNDTYMSRWGYSEGRINVCVVPCDDLAEAHRIYNYIKNKRKNDQNRVRIVMRKPHSRGRLLSNLSEWKKKCLV